MSEIDTESTRCRLWPAARIGLALCFSLLAWTATGAERVELSRFASDGLERWQTRGFDDVPASDYALVELDGRTVLRARCAGGASLIGVEREIDLERTPVLHWSWRVDNVFSGIEERRKAGDDFAARVYVVIDGGLLVWRTRAVNYVWASREPAGTNWLNPFRDEAMMVALQSGDAGSRRWVHESRNVKADFRRFFDRDATRIDGIALMTDCDNHGGEATAYYDNIYFAPE